LSSITLVVARADNGVIGRDGGLPWHLPADLKHFRQVTAGSAMIMGRRTFESLPGVLPGRRHIVMTRDSRWRRDGVSVVDNADAAIAETQSDPVSVIGGAEVFALFEPLADAVELTEVHLDADGDTSIPPFDPQRWHEVSRVRHEAVDGRPAYSFVRLKRAR